VSNRSRVVNILAIGCGVLGAIALIAVVLVRFFVFQTYSMGSASMMPTLNTGDIVVVSLRAYVSDAPARGDIVVLKAHHDGERWIKRVIGLPGDRVRMADGIPVINGKPVVRTRLTDFIDPSSSSPVPRYRETDGRSYETLDLAPNSDFDDTALFVVPPDSFFVLGDNRDNSDDSRVSLGFVARSDITGKVVRSLLTRANGVALAPVE